MVGSASFGYANEGLPMDGLHSLINAHIIDL